MKCLHEPHNKVQSTSRDVSIIGRCVRRNREGLIKVGEKIQNKGATPPAKLNSHHRTVLPPMIHLTRVPRSMDGWAKSHQLTDQLSPRLPHWIIAFNNAICGQTLELYMYIYHWFSYPAKRKKKRVGTNLNERSGGGRASKVIRFLLYKICYTVNSYLIYLLKLNKSYVY
jgi:hypothetical protein